VLEAAAEQAEPPQAVMMLAEAAIGALYAADAAGMRACGDRAAALAPPDSRDRTSIFGRMAKGMGLVFAGDGRGAASIRDAVRLLERSDELRSDSRLLEWALMGPLWLREAASSSSGRSQPPASAPPWACCRSS
jgi:hypothetical protein